jgi:hypothetical protein
LGFNHLPSNHLYLSVSIPIAYAVDAALLALANGVVVTATVGGSLRFPPQFRASTERKGATSYRIQLSQDIAFTNRINLLRL